MFSVLYTADTVSVKLASLILLMFVAACACSPSSPWGVPSRSITLNAVLQSPDGTPLGSVFASLEETRGDPIPRALSVTVSDPVSVSYTHLTLPTSDLV